ncbi:unnamed protein product [Prunus armeniaca]|uniref:Uncharacterized protein n=1 Tax=Prunus armeniaca TaxID=36596 RepID=A0A6J5TKY3_PRUAR|nr:unnamed protein product [Prunus armeniaca]
MLKNVDTLSHDFFMHYPPSEKLDTLPVVGCITDGGNRNRVIGPAEWRKISPLIRLEYSLCGTTIGFL